MSRQRGGEAKARAEETVRELAALSVRLHAALVQIGLREVIGGLTRATHGGRRPARCSVERGAASRAEGVTLVHPMRVVGVRVELPANQPVVLLREEDGVRYLPIWIGAVEASAIAFQQQGVQTLRGRSPTTCSAT